MDPRIRYAKAGDGTAIAFWTAGEGANLLHLPWLPWGNAQLEWRDPELSLWYQRLAGRCHLIRYDGRGSGLSDHESASFGVEAQVADIEAVAQRLDLARVALLASLNMGPAAITYAVQHPEQVSHLILWCTYASAREYAELPRVKTVRSILETDWDLYTETAAHAFLGWSSGQGVDEIARLMRESTTADQARRFYAAMADTDCSPLLTLVTTPTLIIHPRSYPLLDIDAVHRLAADIPEARLVLFEGSSLSPTRGDLDGVLDAIIGFIGEQPAEARRQQDSLDTANPDGLSKREIEVLALIAQGLSNREIAGKLVLSARTVERHAENIYTKIGANNRAQATAYAFGNALI